LVVALSLLLGDGSCALVPVVVGQGLGSLSGLIRRSGDGGR